jgi:hypothetical protein
MHPDETCETLVGEEAVETPPSLFRLGTGKWVKRGWGYQPEIEWSDVIGLDMPDRKPLEDLALHMLRTPGIVAVRITELKHWPNAGLQIATHEG